ncbi:MAG: NUDIX hydrolase [bacterium]|nr:NUDIX hydrolase [bacterium]
MKVVTRAILVQGDKVFIGKRAGGYGAGQWALIGGKPDEGESPADAIRREVREEIGVEFDPVLFSDMVSDPADYGGSEPWRVYVFAGPFRGTPNLNTVEITDVALVGPNDLDGYDIAFDHRDVLKEFFSRRA